VSGTETSSRGRSEWADAALAAEFARLPRIGVLESIRRYWLLALLPVVVLVAAAAVLAQTRPSTYTAQARLQVGRLNISPAGAVSGFAEAAQTLASAYARAITSDGVVDSLATRFHTTPSAIRARISATPVPSSPIVSIFATGPSARQAVTLANAASAALVSYLVRSNQNSPDARRLLQEIRVEELAFQRALAARQAIKRRPPLGIHGQQVAANLDDARLQLSSLEAAYQATVGSEAVSSLLQPLNQAYSASSNRAHRLQIAVFAGLVLGVLIGLALATLRANLAVRRVLMSPSFELDDRGPLS
jgi:curli biogenesis system outer membrane secretion channel CsgG